MNDKIYTNMILRRRFCKRVFYMAIVFSISFYVTVLLFGDIKLPRVMHLTDLGRCPACYGVSVCPELYSNQINLESHHWGNMFFNAKNIYYGYTKTNRKVVLKKLAHNWELKDFDSNLCKTWDLHRNCKPTHLLNASNPTDRIMKLVHYNITHPDQEVRKGLIVCPYVYSLYDFLKPVLKSMKSDKSYHSDLINVWTMLSINPEPIMLQVIKKSKGWPVPAYGGVCGRLELVSHEGESLANLMNAPWKRKLSIALKILDAAMDFTFRHERFRFYLMDWSIDNIVVNDKDEVTFVDLEDVIVLDKQISPKKDLPNWYKRYARDSEQEFTFSIENLCKHHLSDHNLWAACYILAGPENPLLYPMPIEFQTHFQATLMECLTGGDRFKSVTLLQHMLKDYSLIH